MTMGKISGGFLQNLAVALTVAVVGGVLAAYADIPKRVAVVESQVSDVKADQADIKQTVHEILERMPRGR